MRLLSSIALSVLVGCSTVPQVIAVPMAPDAGIADRAYTVTGTATIEALPDVADLVVVLSAERTRPSDAAAEVRQSEALLAASLGSAGVTAADIAVSRLSLSPVYELVDPRGAKTRLRGYEAKLAVTVSSTDFELLPELMDIAARCGATNLSSALRVRDITAIKQRAREEAGAVARRKAESMAGVLGVTLGPVRAISESDGRMGAFDNNFLSNERSHAPSSDGAHGEATDVTVSVSVTYALD